MAPLETLGSPYLSNRLDLEDDSAGQSAEYQHEQDDCGHERRRGEQPLDRSRLPDEVNRCSHTDTMPEAADAVSTRGSGSALPHVGEMAGELSLGSRYPGWMTTSETTPDIAETVDEARVAARRRRLIGVAIQFVATAVAFAVLKRTPDSRLRGPRWLWQIIVPFTVTKATDGALIVSPLGPILFFLFGRRRAPIAEPSSG